MRLIDADELIVLEYGGIEFVPREFIDSAPPIEPQIIRCKDCKHYGRADKRRFFRGYDCLDGRIASIVPDKDFCSRAERIGE